MPRIITYSSQDVMVIFFTSPSPSRTSMVKADEEYYRHSWSRKSVQFQCVAGVVFIKIVRFDLHSPNPYERGQTVRGHNGLVEERGHNGPRA